ncbi:uncharacterized protein LOC103025292 [Astyanax mexicanus]|uniref:uncharacterized protein LOC103025292 n=1 Tax=Astyanax mexicanus TaxID=7994 RepID=UPI0020CABE69|nr:uncharacterized protein LOC103025292 [Astyanax mexicanus]
MAREWRTYTNSRGYKETCCIGEHVSLWEMKMDPQLDNHYLRMRYTPSYPQPVVFYVPDVMHVTDESGLQGIFTDGGFRIAHYGKNNFLWFSLSVTDNNIAEAEDNFLDYIYPDGWNQQEGFLKDFTTSPAFQSESRYGNFCFTFSLRELLSHYASQFCCNSAPVFRVLGTKIYKQEIMYSVLVHPRYIDHYKHYYPRLPRGDEEVCGYFQGQMSWSCQAPSGTHYHMFQVDRKDGTVYGSRLGPPIHYVWDHVTVAFHMEPQWVLHVNRTRLYQTVTVCKVAQVNLLRDPGAALSKDKAKRILELLGRNYRLV